MLFSLQLFYCFLLAFDAIFFLLSIQVTVEISWVNIKPALLCMTFVLACARACVCVCTQHYPHPYALCFLCGCKRFHIIFLRYFPFLLFFFFCFFTTKTFLYAFIISITSSSFAQDGFLKRFFMAKLLNCIELQTQQMRAHTHTRSLTIVSHQQ